MKAGQITSNALPRNTLGDTQLIIGLDKDSWLKTITAGQIIKGRVLRVYSENKYGVDFGGQERIVDSTIAFSKGDTFAGRVTDVNERSVSMKFISSQESENVENDKPIFLKQTENRLPIEIESDRFRIPLNQLQQSEIIKAANSSKNSGIAISVGLYLAKLGVPISSELVRVLTDRVLETKANNYAQMNKMLPELTSNIDNIESLNSNFTQTIHDLKNFFLNDFENNENALAESNKPKLSGESSITLNYQLSQDSSNDAQQDFANKHRLNKLLTNIFNLSNGSYVQHRFQTLPLIIDGKLIEFDVAFFDQSTKESTGDELKSKCVMLALKTDFGVLNLEARIVNNRINISLSSESDFLIRQSEEFKPELDSDLTSAGWMVDNIEYVTKSNVSSVAYEVINHVLQQDSLNITV